MFNIIIKEIRSFFSGPIAYMVLFLFVNLCNFLLFVLPSGYNLLDARAADLQAYFQLIPLVFLFLIPALCMRSFSEEKKNGNLESLFSRPVTEWDIIMGKYLACLFLTILSLLPAFLYIYTLGDLSQISGNVDMSAFWGSFIGLCFLGASFTAISMFTSSLQKNQISAFISGLLLTAFIFAAFELISKMPMNGSLSLFVSSLGMQDHYVSLSRGVIDLRDIIYFSSLIAIFLLLTHFVIKKNRHKREFKLGSALVFENLASLSRRLKLNIDQSILIFSFVFIFLVNLLASFVYLRIDMTQDHRYSLLPITKSILKSADQDIYIKIYLGGDLPASFELLKKNIQQNLDEFQRYQDRIHYSFVDLYSIPDEKLRREAMKKLVDKGLMPTQLSVKTKDGFSRRLIFPVAEISGQGGMENVNFLEDQYYFANSDQALQSSIQNIELNLIIGIRRLINKEPKTIAFLGGSGEYDEDHLESAMFNLNKFYSIERINFKAHPESILAYDSLSKKYKPAYKLLVIAHPPLDYSAVQRYFLDQYLLRGGRAFWLIEPSDASFDTLQLNQDAIAHLYPNTLESMFFRYGFRLKNRLLLDLNAASVPIVTGNLGDQSQTDFLPCIYTPIFLPLTTQKIHPDPKSAMILQGVGPIKGEFVSVLDTIHNDIIKTPLLYSSPYSKTIPLPNRISVDVLRRRIDTREFMEGPKCVCLLLEGQFPSAFDYDRPNDSLSRAIPFLTKGIASKMIIASDGDFIRNELSQPENNPLYLGFDPYTKQMYDNKNFIVNCAHYLCDDSPLIQLKARRIEMRLLDAQKIEQGKSKYLWINFAIPNALLVVIALILYYYRKKKYIIL